MFSRSRGVWNVRARTKTPATARISPRVATGRRGGDPSRRPIHQPAAARMAPTSRGRVVPVDIPQLLIRIISPRRVDHQGPEDRHRRAGGLQGIRPEGTPPAPRPGDPEEDDQGRRLRKCRRRREAEVAEDADLDDRLRAAHRPLDRVGRLGELAAVEVLRCRDLATRHAEDQRGDRRRREHGGERRPPGPRSPVGPEVRRTPTGPAIIPHGPDQGRRRRREASPRRAASQPPWPFATLAGPASIRQEAIRRGDRLPGRVPPDRRSARTAEIAEERHRRQAEGGPAGLAAHEAPDQQRWPRRTSDRTPAPGPPRAAAPASRRPSPTQAIRPEPGRGGRGASCAGPRASRGQVGRRSGTSAEVWKSRRRCSLAPPSGAASLPEPGVPARPRPAVRGAYPSHGSVQPEPERQPPGSPGRAPTAVHPARPVPRANSGEASPAPRTTASGGFAARRP